MRGLILATLWLATTLSGEEPTSADPLVTGGDGAEAIETFTLPKLRRAEIEPLKYPRRQRVKGREGWVYMNFMVDTQGKPYEIEVADSVGGKAFEEAAVKAAETWRFEPATLNGVAIDAGHGQRATFELIGPNPKPIRKAFAERYQLIIEAIAQQDRITADKWITSLDESWSKQGKNRRNRLASLEAQNLYEDVALHHALYKYYEVWGNDEEQLKALYRVVGREKEPHYLPEFEFVSALRNIFVLQVRQKRYAGALGTWDVLQAQALEKDQLASLERVVQQIYDLRDGARPFSRIGEITNNARQGHGLLKKKFSFKDIDGELAELKLYCEKGFVGFRFQQGTQYTVRDNLGNCGLTVIGNPGTTYTLVEF